MSFFLNKQTNDPLVGRITAVLLLIGIAVPLFVRGCTLVDPGHVGVRSFLGKIDTQEFQSGFNLKNPLVSVIEMTTRTREAKETITVPTSEGLIAGLDVSALYHLNGEQADEVYVKLGNDDNYEANIVRPLIRSTVRDVVANYKAEDLYTNKREQVAKDVQVELEQQFGKRGLVLEQVLIRDLQLPSRLVDAIQSKLSAEQEALRYHYVVQRERQEAERKKVEAEGIATAQEIISTSLTQEYLNWKYIETLKELIDSPNNTVIILPFDQKLTPLLPIQPIQVEKK